MLNLLIAALSPAALACGGVYIPAQGTGADLTSDASKLVVAVNDDNAVYTIAPVVGGDVDDFAMIIPVPTLPQADDIQLGSAEVMQFWDTATQPRFVEESCTDHTGPTERSCESRDGGEGEGEGEGESASGVDVEGEWVLGDYTLVALSAEQSSDLLGWLDSEGYAVSPKLDAVLQAWIDDGMYFVAAKIRPDAPLDAQSTLDPLRVRVWSTEVRLPLGAGTVHSTGTQDVLLYVVTDSEDRGYANISNYPGTTLEDDCLWTTDARQDSFAEFYGGWFDAAFAQSDGFLWTQEYSGMYWIEGEPELDLDWPRNVWSETGLASDPAAGPFVNRLHLRFTADAVGPDPIVALGPATNTGALVYYAGPEGIQAYRPVCGVGEVDPGDAACPQPEEPDCPDSQRSQGDDAAYQSSGCQVVGGAPPLAASLMVLGMLAIGVGRRTDDSTAAE